MYKNYSLIVSIFILVIFLWIIGLAISMMFKKHNGYLKYSKKEILGFLKKHWNFFLGLLLALLLSLPRWGSINVAFDYQHKHYNVFDGVIMLIICLWMVGFIVNMATKQVTAYLSWSKKTASSVFKKQWKLLLGLFIGWISINLTS